MTIETLDEDKIVLPEILDLNSVGDLKQLLLQGLAQNASSALDGSNVSRITTPAVQILLAYAKSLAADGRKPLIQFPSDQLRAAFKDLGLEPTLSQWSVK